MWSGQFAQVIVGYQKVQQETIFSNAGKHQDDSKRKTLLIWNLKVIPNEKEKRI